jgi:hypothetical protein
MYPVTAAPCSALKATSSWMVGAKMQTRVVARKAALHTK